MSPRVSVVIPTYDNDAYIQATMNSVIAQTYEDFELVVADHSSTDRTWELLQPYAADPRVRLLRTPAGGGAQRNWNAVSKAATGELVKLVCGDDVLYRDILRRQVQAFNAHDEGVVMVASPRDVVDASGRPIVRNLGLAGLRGRVEGRQAVRQSVLRGTNIWGAVLRPPPEAHTGRNWVVARRSRIRDRPGHLCSGLAHWGPRRHRRTGGSLQSQWHAMVGAAGAAAGGLRGRHAPRVGGHATRPVVPIRRAARQPDGRHARDAAPARLPLPGAAPTSRYRRPRRGCARRSEGSPRLLW